MFGKMFRNLRASGPIRYCLWRVNCYFCDLSSSHLNVYMSCEPYFHFRNLTILLNASSLKVLDIVSSATTPPTGSSVSLDPDQ